MSTEVFDVCLFAIFLKIEKVQINLPKGWIKKKTLTKKTKKTITNNRRRKKLTEIKKYVTLMSKIQYNKKSCRNVIHSNVA